MGSKAHRDRIARATAKLEKAEAEMRAAVVEATTDPIDEDRVSVTVAAELTGKHPATIQRWKGERS